MSIALQAPDFEGPAFIQIQPIPKRTQAMESSAQVIAAVLAWINSINGLQTSAAKLTEQLAKKVSDLSDAQKDALAADVQAIKDAGDDQGKIAIAQAQLQQDQAKFQGDISEAQSRVDGWNTLIGNISKGEPNLFQNMQSLITILQFLQQVN